MEKVEDIQYVVLANKRAQWGRGNSLRAALSDAGWRGNMHEIPPGVEAWINLQAEEDRCSAGGIMRGEFAAWDDPSDANREEPVRPGGFAPPFVTNSEDKESSIIHKGALIKIW